MSSSQIEKRTMVFTHVKKKDTSNKNRERCFFTCVKHDMSNQKPQRCVSFEFRAKTGPPLIDACSLQRRFFQREKIFSKSFSCKKGDKHIGNWSGIVSFVSCRLGKV